MCWDSRCHVPAGILWQVLYKLWVPRTLMQCMGMNPAPPASVPAQVRYLPAELLREVNVVDTPGTNVILSRQQRLTEEYVPRADLVLFVLSADRPFTESEVNFLKYIRRAHTLFLLTLVVDAVRQS